MSGPFKRLSDLLNYRERDFFTVEDAALAPVVSASTNETARRIVTLGRSHVHFVATAPEARIVTGQLHEAGVSRDHYVEKVPVRCYVFTDAFILLGTCYLHREVTLERLLDSSSLFLPFTGVTIRSVARPQDTRQRDFIVMNKTKIDVMYPA